MPGMESAESIYALIPEPEYVPPKPKMYRSKHSGKIVTAGGKGAATMGPAKVPTREPTKFLRKREKDINLPNPEKFARSAQNKPAVPVRSEKPVMGLTTKKNFVTANAVENILAVPKKTGGADANFLQKPEYGKAPKYLNRVKAEVQDEYRIIQGMQDQANASDGAGGQMQVISDEEREALVMGLKMNWERINKAYQTLSFTLDTPAKRTRKEQYEAQLEQIERDIERLGKRFIFVNDDMGY